jgi:Flp pilus assembly secretin CpaC
MRRAAFVRSSLLSLAAACCLSLAPVGAAIAADSSMTVYADQAKVLKVNGTASSVIVGNPMIADVVLQGGVVAVQGRHFGNTNVLILDSRGNEIASIQVNVLRQESNSVQIYKGAPEGKIVGKHSFICAPDCESVMMPGDDVDYNSLITAQIGAKSKEALTSAQAGGE